MLVLAIPSAASGNDPRQLWLAQYCVNEASFTLSDDCGAIADVLRNRSQTGRITRGIIWSYSRGEIFNRNRTDRMRYVPYLNPFGRKPRFWDDVSTVSWSRRRQIWLQIYERAGRILNRTEQSKCEDRVDHWGAPSLDRRSRRRGWTQISCGNTYNHYWKI